MVGSFMDALILGIIAVVWCVWFVKARPTERDVDQVYGGTSQGSLTVSLGLERA
jgi:hypothetical protein